MVAPPSPKPCVHFFCGKAGAGKSRLAHALAESHAAFLISEDVWLARLYGGEMHTFEDYRRFSLRLRTVVEPLAVELLRSGRNVVLDFPANTKSSRAWMRSLAEQSGAAPLLHFLATPDATCLERIAQRNVERPEGSHHLTPEQFEHISSYFEPPGSDEQFEVRRHEPS